MSASLADAAYRWRDRGGKTALAGAATAALVPLVAFVFPVNQAEGRALDVAVVQGNIPRYREPSYEKDRAILDNHVRLTASLPDEVDLVVWPESSIGIDPFRDDEVGTAIAEAARSIGKPMIVGGNLDRDDGRYQVMAYLVSPEGEIVDQYQKTHLVPFGEFVPARDSLDWIPALDQVPRDAVPGSEKTLFEVAGGTVAPVISFEGDFGSLVRSRVAVGGRLVVVATNTSTWEDSSASAQHVAMSQVRAAENGTYVAHGALTGISAIIEPSGRVMAESQLWTSDVLIQRVRFSEAASFYARTGDWFALLCVALCAGWGLSRVLLRRRVPSADD
jgi:apolipoprotein N-acyltransferase